MKDLGEVAALCLLISFFIAWWFVGHGEPSLLSHWHSVLMGAK